eukprot:3219522-Amphidinium_carterae.1
MQGVTISTATCACQDTKKNNQKITQAYDLSLNNSMGVRTAKKAYEMIQAQEASHHHALLNHCVPVLHRNSTHAKNILRRPK